jgi:CRP-like cAMP-binding protein
MILDFFTGLAINIEQPYKLGDYITVHQRKQEQDITGQIVEINWRVTRIKTENSNVVIVPNNQMSKFVVTNYWNNDLPMRDEIEFCLDFSVPIQRSRRVLVAGAQAVADSGIIFSDPKPEVLVKETNDLGVVYRVRYWIKPWEPRSPSRFRDAVITSILEHLTRAGLTLAYPKEDIYYERLPHRQLDTSSFEDQCELLKKIDLFNTLEQKEINRLAEQMHQIDFKTEDIIITQGQNGDTMYLVLEGLLEVYINQSNGKEPLKIAILLPGNFFGEMSLLTGDPRMATVKAVTDGVLYEISKGHMQELFNNRPEIVHSISNIMAVRNSSNIKKLAELNNKEKTVEESAQHFMKRITSFFKGPN